VAHDERLDARRAGALERTGSLDIGDDDRNRCVEALLRDCIDQRLQVAATAGDEDTEPAIHCHLRYRLPE
jgi:hypothetical protein